jgi:hypothetical protein
VLTEYAWVEHPNILKVLGVFHAEESALKQVLGGHAVYNYHFQQALCVLSEYQPVSIQRIIGDFRHHGQTFDEDEL